MPKRSTRSLDFDWCELASTDEDWNRDPADLAWQVLELHTIRLFEERLLALKGQGLVHGPVHSSIGQEAVAVGATAALHSGDRIVATHRAHHEVLAQAMTWARPSGFDPRTDKMPDAVQEVVTRTLAEVMGLAAGWCGGRGGSMHLHAPEVGVLGTSAIVAGGVAAATGAAWAGRYLGADAIVVCFLGDGAVNQGVFHEAVNLGALWNAPVLYLVENNGYAVATSSRDGAHLHAGLLSQRAAAYDLPARVVDGMDPVAVRAAVEDAAADLRRGGHPVLVEALTYRFLHHGGDLPGHAFGYRDKAEEDAWARRDPVAGFGRALADRGLLSPQEQDPLRAEAQALVRRAVDACSVDGREVRADRWPDPRTVSQGAQSDGRELAGVRYAPEAPAAPTRELTYVQAIAAVTARRMDADDRVIVLGEEVGHMGGGAYQATRGLAERFPGRVLDTPISEAGFCGFACGAAMAGLRPVVEIMFPDFALVAADQLFNHIGNLRHMYGGRMPMPIMCRTRIAIGVGYGGQHSMDPVGLFALFPGWRIVAPASAYEYIGLFNAALRCEDPVLIVEHQALYERAGLVPDEDADYLLPLDRARVVTPGDRVTVLAYSAMVPRIEALAADNDAVELVDLRALDPAHVDYATIGASLRKTGALVIADESTRSCSVAATIAHECTARFFDDLDGPVLRVSGADAPKPVSRVLEQAAIPSDEEILATIRAAAQREA